MNRSLEEYGEKRLLVAVREVEGCCAEAIILRLIGAATTFADGAPQSDDMTLIVLRVT